MGKFRAKCHLPEKERESGLGFVSQVAGEPPPLAYFNHIAKARRRGRTEQPCAGLCTRIQPLKTRKRLKNKARNC
jgi:hypothetical protein